MSGGIDSNSIIGISKKILNHDVHAFTIVTNDERYDENEMVAATVNGLRLRHTVVSISHHDFLGNLREQVRYHDAPVSTISYYVHWLLQEEIHRSGYRISVSVWSAYSYREKPASTKRCATRCGSSAQ